MNRDAATPRVVRHIFVLRSETTTLLSRNRGAGKPLIPRYYSGGRADVDTQLAMAVAYGMLMFLSCRASMLSQGFPHPRGGAWDAARAVYKLGAMSPEGQGGSTGVCDKL